VHASTISEVKLQRFCKREWVKLDFRIQLAAKKGKDQMTRKQDTKKGKITAEELRNMLAETGIC
jgi:tmRNA-binding protein